MRFLAVTTFQALLLAAFTASVILALYFLKHKRQRVVISSVLLWRKVIESRIENSIFEKLRRRISILIAVITGLLVAMAIARPEIALLSGPVRQAVVVLDTSPSMQARTSDGKTRWQHATERAVDLINEAAAGTEFRIADTGGQFDFPSTADRVELRSAIAGMHPLNSSTRFPDAAGAEDVYVITDGVSPFSVPAGAVSISVFETAPNVGITAFEVRSTPSLALAYEAYLEVWNFGRNARDVEINISGAGSQRITKKTRLNAGASYNETLDLSQFDGGGIRASVQSDGDALSVDDAAYAYVPVKRRTKTLLVTRGGKPIETVFKLDRLLDVTVVDPKAYVSAADFDVVVFDDFVPAVAPTRPALFLGFQDVSWLRRPLGTIERPRLESIRENHPVLRAVALQDVSIGRATRLDPTNLVVLAAASGNMPLIVASEKQSRWIMLTFDLQDSDFPYHSGFPLFIDNAMAWLSRERLALRRSPGVVDVPLPGAQIRTIDGRTVASTAYLSGATFEADDPGLYVAVQANERQYIAVNFANHRYSDINNSRVRESASLRVAGSILHRELWFYLIVAALALIGGEWWTYHRRITL
jgi:Ca-activated chloride channel homolog